MRNKVVLVHGFNKDHNDMIVLKKNLEKMNYHGLLVNLPLTFKTIDGCRAIFESKIKTILDRSNQDEKIYLVGHSTGGLIIRNFLSTTKYLNRISRVVLIATPNQGSVLSDLFNKAIPRRLNVFKTLESLKTDNVKKLHLKNIIDTVEVGGIAGNRNNLLLGHLINEENDGRVEVSSVKYRGLKDFIILPYGHKEIHYQFETAKLVDSFLQNGKFCR
ncbi:alpha/beta fold hydrolase [Natronincola ferrireducens]|uniref:Alpha/beta hydrolase family protein n=1 Tax=Natronincola ferrireducens TaxID=393762 RepID=A0A1G8ZPW6_9FIRM|nr:alpha/beta fold hydrolase [Natronincola ferrireducens]SDK17149.1 Alpha/beta hydrolase family protein [Natronincola ferrireducens]